MVGIVVDGIERKTLLQVLISNEYKPIQSMTSKMNCTLICYMKKYTYVKKQ